MKNRSTCTSNTKHPGVIPLFSFSHKWHFYQQEENEVELPSHDALPLNIFSASLKISVIIQIAQQVVTLSRDHWKLHLDRGMWKKGVNGTALHFLLCIHSTFISHKGCSSQALHCFILTVVLNQLHFTDTVNKKNCERECPESGAVKNPSALYFCLICSPFFPRNDKEQTPCSTA